MKFIIQGRRGSMVAEKEELQPAFVKGAMTAHEGREKENPYTRESFQEAYELGYYGVKRGSIIVDPQTVMTIECMYCKKEMGAKDGKGVDGLTSSICEECWEEHNLGIPYPGNTKITYLAGYTAVGQDGRASLFCRRNK